MSSSTLPGFDALVAQHRASFPGRVAVVHGEVRLDYAQLHDRAGRLACALCARGFGAGARVLWLGQNSHAVLELFLACSRLGAMLCCANWRQSPEELEFVLRDFDPHAVFWQQLDIGTAVTSARERVGTTSTPWFVVDTEGADSSAELMSSGSSGLSIAPSPVDPQRPLLALYTAAFEGRPGAAMLSETGLYLQAMVHAHAFEVSHLSAALVSAPLFHITGWLDLLPVLLQGGTLLIARRADPEELLQLIATERATTGTIHPPTAQSIADLNATRGLDLSCFRSALRMPGWAEMTRPGPGIGGYGQTEVAGPLVVGAYAGQGSTPFCGRPSCIAEVRIVDDQDRDLPAGETGEILVRGPTTGLGYWNRPELNTARTAPGGWWRTRDLGRRDADGTISFVGPKTRFLKTGGENVYPTEVEAALLTHPAVQRAAIIGTPDPQWAQLVTAVIVRRPGVEVSDAELIAHVRTKLAAYKAPRIVHFTETLPTTAAGAVDYAALDARYGGGNYPGQGPRTATTIGAGA